MINMSRPVVIAAALAAIVEFTVSTTSTAYAARKRTACDQTKHMEASAIADKSRPCWTNDNLSDRVQSRASRVEAPKQEVKEVPVREETPSEPELEADYELRSAL